MEWFNWMSDPAAWISLVTLTLLEIVLGIDNIIFISLLTGKLPKHQQPKAQRVGLMLALFSRVALLCSLVWLARLSTPLFHFPPIFGMAAPHPVSVRDLILIIGGLFLLFKSTREIHAKLEEDEVDPSKSATASYRSILFQVVLIDIVFSLDSVITAVGLSQRLPVMITAVVISMMVMVALAGKISDFINRHPAVKMLALSFLLLIGMMLVAEGCGQKVPKGYLYFAMAFSVLVEVLNMKTGSRKPTKKSAPEEKQPAPTSE